MEMLKKVQDRLLALVATKTKKLIGVTVAGTLLAASYLHFDGKLDPLWAKLTPKQAVGAEVEALPAMESDVPTVEAPVEVMPEVVTTVEAAPAEESPPPIAVEEVVMEDECPSGTLNLMTTSGEHIGCILNNGDRSNQ